MKKVINILLVLSVAASIIYPVSAAGTVLLRIAPENGNMFTVAPSNKTSPCVTEVKDGIYVTDGNGDHPYPMFTFGRPIEVTTLDTVINYKVKVEQAEGAGLDYITIRLRGSEGTSTELPIVIKPVGGQWYEGSFKLKNTVVSTGQRAFDVGDMLMRIAVIASNKSKIDGQLYIEYLEVAEPDESLFSLEEKIIRKLEKDIRAAKPGDVIYVEDGVYKDISFVVKGFGEEGLPITVKARNPGKAVFTGNSYVTISGSYVTIDGFYFKDGYADGVVTFTSDSDHCRLTNSAVINYNNEDNLARENYVRVWGLYHTLDHNYFREKRCYGQIMEIMRPTNDPNYTTVEYNYFGYYYANPAINNGLETFRIGTSTLSGSYANCTVRYNFFEHCDAESEVVSNKSSGNTYSYNTFFNNNGGLWLRQGSDNIVNGNVFIGGVSTNQPTGICLHSRQQKVYDNYFYNLGTRSQAVSLPYCTEDGAPLSFYEPITGLDFYRNTFIDNNLNLLVGFGAGKSGGKGENGEEYYRIVPPHGNVKDNLFYSTKTGDFTIFEARGSMDGLIFSNNVAYGKPLGVEKEGIITEDPKLVLDENGFWVPTSREVGARPSEVNKAPKHPTEITPDWITAMYESGELTFDTEVDNPFLPKENSNEDDGKITIKISGKILKTDVDPVIKEDRVLLPMRGIFEAFGAEVKWDDLTQTAEAQFEGRTVTITENAKTALLDGQEVELDAPAFVKEGRFLVPIRFVSESFGAMVEWRELVRTVTVILPKSPAAALGIENALYVHNATSSGDDGVNTVEGLYDGNLATRWSYSGSVYGQSWAEFDLGSAKTLDEIYILYVYANRRSYKFSIEVSEDGVNYTTALDKQTTSGKAIDFENFSLGGAKGRYVKFLGFGSNEGPGNNIWEIVFTEKK